MSKSPIPFSMWVSLRHLQPHATARSRRELAAAKLQYEQSEQRMLVMDALVKGIFRHMAGDVVGDVETPGEMEIRILKSGFELVRNLDNTLAKESSLAARLDKLFEAGPAGLEVKGLSAPDPLELPAGGSSDDGDDDQAAFWLEANLVALATMAKERAASLEKTRDYVRANCADALRR